MNPKPHTDPTEVHLEQQLLFKAFLVIKSLGKHLLVCLGEQDPVPWISLVLLLACHWHL